MASLWRVSKVAVEMITYSTNWMGPVNLHWYEERGLLEADGVTPTIRYSAGRIDIRGLDEEYYYNGQHEYGLRPMHQEDWDYLTIWLKSFRTKKLLAYHTLIEKFQKDCGRKIRWS